MAKIENSTKEKLFVDLFKQNREKIYRLCFAYLIDKKEVDDLFQQIMINVWKSLDKFRQESQISTWVYRIAVNTAFLFNKKTKRKNNLFMNYSSELFYYESESKIEYEDEKNDMIKILLKCINTLKKQDRVIISLVLEGLKYDEIAEITGLTSNNIAVKINRIKPVLLKLMKEEQYG